MNRSTKIPVNLVTGFLGVGKTTAIRHLLKQVPAGERWAVLVNEFGEIGVDGALVADSGDGETDIVVQEVAGGCLCCVAAPAFTTGLNRLIRRHAPDRLLIEPSGLGHPAQVLETLEGPLYAAVLEVRATVCLMDPRHLASARHREHPNFIDQVHLSDVLVANKGDLCSAADIAAFENFATTLRPRKARLAVVAHGRIDLAWIDLGRSSDRQAAFPEAHAFLVDAGAATGGVAADVDETEWLLIEGVGDGYHRAGWLIRQRAAWPLGVIRGLIDGLAVERRKGLFLTDSGWLACNQENWSAVAAPADGRSRLEIIDPSPLPADIIDGRLRAIAGSA